MNKLNWVSRHPMNAGQKAIVSQMGYDGENQIKVIFGIDPIEDLQKALPCPKAWGKENCATYSQDTGCSKSPRDCGVKTVAIVAPSYVIFKLLVEGYKIIEFVNVPSARERGVFICQGAYVTSLTKIEDGDDSPSWTILGYTPQQDYVSCPLTEEEQEEGKLT